MTSKITVLGSGSCNLVPDKMAASVLIQRDGKNIVYDFGRGAAIRITELGLKQANITTIILSHLHPDHVTDLYPFLHAASWSHIDPRHSDLTIYGQPGTKDFIAKLLSVFDDQQLSRNFAITAVDAGPGLITIEGVRFQLVDLHHSFGLKFEEGDKRYAVMGDASLREDLIDALHEVDLGVFDSGHLTDNEIIELAVKSEAKRLVCSHQYRELDESALNAAAKAKGYTGRLIVARDLMAFTL